MRLYQELAARVAPGPDRTATMQRVVDVLWDGLHASGLSWVGFYLHDGGDALLLGPRRDKPACSPIDLHGACGQCFRSRVPLVVHDVRDLGAGYIACDPRDQSEVVVPCFAADGTCWGVLDADSHDVRSFTDADAAGLTAVLRAAGLTT